MIRKSLIQIAVALLVLPAVGLRGQTGALTRNLTGEAVRVEAADGKRASPEKEIAMTQHATGTFEVKLSPQDDKSDDKSMGRMTFEKQWHGDLEGTSRGQMLTGGDASKGSAVYVAIEKVTCTLNTRKGTFILQHWATMTKGKGDLNIVIAPDSGTDQLAGISGKLTIKIENGKHFYDLEYSLN